jgi:small subunit ribosomal protein S20
MALAIGLRNGRGFGYPSWRTLLSCCRPGGQTAVWAGQADFNPNEGRIRVANIKSQIKRIKQNEKAHQRNKAVKSELRTHVRKFREAIEGGNVEEATAALRVATRKLDKAASKGVIHKNQAANRKSAIAKRLADLQSA